MSFFARGAAFFLFDFRGFFGEMFDVLLDVF